MVAGRGGDGRVVVGIVIVVAAVVEGGVIAEGDVMILMRMGEY